MSKKEITQAQINQLWRRDFDRVRPETQYSLEAKKWIVRVGNEEIVIKRIEDWGPVLHGRMPDKSEVCFSPACVIRHE